MSGDAGVSFKTPTRISPRAAEYLVRAHEGEHVAIADTEARAEGGRAYSTVSIHYGTCPECGRTYVSGGTTETTKITPIKGDVSQSQNNRQAPIDVYA